jgi:hypothetical protein
MNNSTFRYVEGVVDRRHRRADRAKGPSAGGTQEQRQPSRTPVAAGQQAPGQLTPGQLTPGQQPPGNPITQAAGLSTGAGAGAGAGNRGAGPDTADTAAGPSTQARGRLPHTPKPPTQAGPGR